MNNSAPVRGAPFNGGAPQQWRIAPGKDGNPLITSRLGKTLDIPNGTSRDGARIQIYDPNGDSNQRFVFRRVGELPREADRDRDRRWERYEGRFDDRDRTWKIEGDGACFYREPGFRGRAFLGDLPRTSRTRV